MGFYYYYYFASVTRHPFSFKKIYAPQFSSWETTPLTPSAQTSPEGLKGGACGSGLTNQSVALPVVIIRFRVSMGPGKDVRHETASAGASQWVEGSCSYPLWLTLAGCETGIVCNHLTPWEARKPLGLKSSWYIKLSSTWNPELSPGPFSYVEQSIPVVVVVVAVVEANLSGVSSYLSPI